MRKTMCWGILGLGLALALVGTAVYAADPPPSARAFMAGDMVVPPVDSMALGYVTFVQSADGNSWHYKVIVANLLDVTAAHIHVGKVGEEGPPIVNLFTGPAKTGRFDGVLSEGDFDATAFMGPLAGKTMKDFMDALRGRTLYVNVHTVAHPEGELRGQMMMMGPRPPRPAGAGGGGAAPAGGGAY